MPRGMTFIVVYGMFWKNHDTIIISETLIIIIMKINN